MMNFPPFGTHFPSSIPNIHQFAAKFSQENLSSSTSNQDANSLRYPSNGITSFVHQNQQQSGINGTIKYPNYANEQSNIYVQQNIRNEKNKDSFEQPELSPELCAAVLQQEEKNSIQRVKQEHRAQTQQHNQNQNATPLPVSTWQSLTAPVADYLSHLPASTLPLSLHHFLKYSAENIKKETTAQQQLIQNHDNQIHLQTTSINHLNNGSLLNDNLSTINTNHFQSSNAVVKKKKKKKTTIEKEKKPRPKPGEIRLTTALDGSTLYCCPECHMAYPEKELLEQHLLGHTLERRFVCDICGAGLKRKDHLTRHKQSHNPERPYVCTVCLKAFKRKEQLTLHFVIHSGEKRHICSECGKGFYRKDHLRKHTRSHIARRVKAELSQHGGMISSSIGQNHGISS